MPRVSPMACRAGSSESKDGSPPKGGRYAAAENAQVIQDRLWPRRNAFHTHKALLEYGEK